MDFIRSNYPSAYQYLVEKVKPERSSERNPRLRRDFWLFEANREEMRAGLKGLNQYICTLENSPQRYFTFLAESILPDQKLRVITSNDPYILGVLSSRTHRCFSIRFGGRAGAANTPVYNTKCFTQFPFPQNDVALDIRIRALAEKIFLHRERALEENVGLGLTTIYNLVEKLRDGALPSDLGSDDRLIFDRAHVLILKERHEELDAAVAEAYGWPVDLPEQDVLTRLVALNKERAAEEARGEVRWLRPDYQIPRFGTALQKQDLLELTGEHVASKAEVSKLGKPNFPSDAAAQGVVIMAAFGQFDAPITAAELAKTFKQGKKVEARVAETLKVLAAYGQIFATDKGTRFSTRKAA